MAKKYFTGAAPAIAQETEIQVTIGAAATTYKLTIGDVVISATGAATASGSAANLAAAFEAAKADHPHTARISAAAVTDTVTLSATVAGVPFETTSAATGGSGTIAAASISVNNSGPADLAAAANWSGGVVPANGDEIYFKDGSQNVVFNLDGLAATGVIINIDQTWTGKIGLDPKVFAIDASGDSVTGVPEYRADYLTASIIKLNIGAHDGPGQPNGSQRIKVDNTLAGASVATIFNTAAQASETGKPAVRLLAGSASANINIRSAPGGVGIGVETPGEAPTIGDIQISDTSTRTRVNTGEGVTMANFVQNGGDNVIKAAATITKVTVHGGTLRTEGDYKITTAEINAGTFRPNHINSATGAAITTLNQNAGAVDYGGSLEARDVTTYNHEAGELTADPDALTIGTYNLPTEIYNITIG